MAAKTKISLICSKCLEEIRVPIERCFKSVSQEMPLHCGREMLVLGNKPVPGRTQRSILSSMPVVEPVAREA